jgi:hypothetical protein
MRQNTKLYICLLIVITVLTGTAAAQQADQERDPFFGEGPRSLSTSTSSGTNTWGRDPFVKPFEGAATVEAKQVPERKLTGIIFGKNERIAIIGGELMKEGSMVGDQKLMTIRRRSIVLMNSSGGTEEIFLENFSIRK